MQKLLKSMLGKQNKIQQQHIQNMVQKQQQVKLIKNQYFFLSQKNYKSYDNDPDTYDIDYMNNTTTAKNINSIFFQCTGHGSFKQKQVSRRFLNYLKDTLDKIDISNTRLKIKIKIKLTGFDMKKIGDKFLQQFSKILEGKITFTTSLELRVANFQNVQPSTLSLLIGIGINRQNQNNLTNLTYQFSNWIFINNNDQKKQLTFSQFKQQIIQSLNGKTPLNSLKKFRLEISTWYSQLDEYKHFFNKFQHDNKIKDYQHFMMSGKKIQNKQKAFHYQIYQMIKGFIQLMQNLMSLQLDFRNWHGKFQMAQLKKYFQNPDDLDLKKKMSPSPLSLIRKAVSVSKLQKVISQSKIFKPQNQNNKNKTQEQEKQNQEDQNQGSLEIRIII